MCNFNTETADFFSCESQHVHEIIGSTVPAETCEGCHNHRFATMSEEAIPARGSHFHNVKFRTDTHDDHQHEFCGATTLAIPTGDGRHIHFLKDCTGEGDGHVHEFRVATMINNATEEC